MYLFVDIYDTTGHRGWFLKVNWRLCRGILIVHKVLKVLKYQSTGKKNWSYSLLSLKLSNYSIKYSAELDLMSQI